MVKMENGEEIDKEIIYQMYGDFDEKQLLDAIIDFTKTKGRLYKSRAMQEANDIDLLTEQQKNMSVVFLKKIKNQWKEPIKKLAKKKEIKNKYRSVFLRKFGSLISTTNIDALINIVSRSIKIQDGRIVFMTVFFGEDLKFFCNERERIKVRVIFQEPIRKKTPTLKELRKRKKRCKNVFYLDQDLSNQV